VEPALARLAALSLVVRGEEGQAWIHRWTAEGLAALVEAAGHGERYRRAGDYRIWRIEHESHALEDGLEAVRNYLRGGHFDQAAAVAQGCLATLERFGQTMAIATLAAEVLEGLPSGHGGFAGLADAEARAHLALGESDRAFARYQQLLEQQLRLAKAEPDRADYQRDLSVSYNKMGDLYQALGQGEAARQAYQVRGAWRFGSGWRRRSRIAPITSATSRCRCSSLPPT
jgi:tetratricopeptide (TPR) repeat protein